MILLLDNYDSFTYNLAHLLYRLTPKLVVRRNREITVPEVLAMRPELIVLSPGPGRPEEAGVMPELIRAVRTTIPLFGVCLGHQAIAQSFGAGIIRARRLVHGKTSRIRHDGRGSFAGLDPEFPAVRYHSLAVDEATLPEELEISARSDDGEIMGIRHRTLPIEGVQYHPESILSACGQRQLANFMAVIRCSAGEVVRC